MTRADKGSWLLLLAVPFILVAAILWAPKAAADSTDDAFIAALDSEGISYPSERYAIRAAHVLCDELDRGVDIADVVLDLAKVSYLSVSEAGFMVGASVGAYCDWHILGEMAV